MIQRNNSPPVSGEFAVALHECCHAAIAELEGFPYEYVFLGDGRLADGRIASGGLVPPQNLQEIIGSADETNAKALLLKYAMVARAGHWIDISQSAFTEEQARIRSSGDWDMFTQLFGCSVLEDSQRDDILNDSVAPFEGHVQRPGFLKSVNALALELVTRRELKPSDVQRILRANGLLRDAQ